MKVSFTQTSTSAQSNDFADLMQITQIQVVSSFENLFAGDIQFPGT